MLPTLLAALSLFSAFQDQPISTAPRAPQPQDSAPVATSTTEAPPPSPTAPAGSQADDPDYLPVGAPSDDYGFVAWCDGVLAGHMDLGERVKDVLPIDPMQQKIGKAYLRAYVKALDSAPESKTDEGAKRAEAARQDGWSRWEPARTANHKLGADTYLAYQLPGRCEHAAVRLAHDPELFHLAPSVAEVSAMAPSVGTPAADAPAKAATKSSKRKKAKS